MNKIAKHLKKSAQAVAEDCNNFNKYAYKQIGIKTCMKRFIENNNCRNIDFEEDEFKEWVESLGYKRR